MMAVEAVCCELVSDIPAIREKYRDFLLFSRPISEDFPVFHQANNRLATSS